MNQLPQQADLFNIKVFQPIQALTWKQPFASLMLEGKIETREWSTNHRGNVLICAGLKEYNEDELIKMCHEWQLNKMAEAYMSNPASFIFGHAIAVGVLVKCRPMVLADEEKTYVKYKSGLWCHEYRDVRRIEPVPITGGRKWMTINDQEILKQVVFI